jgi:hypothetical protein
LTQIHIDDNPFVLPDGYRIRYRFFLMPIEVAGTFRWLEYVPVVQMFVGGRHGANSRCDENWHDVGFLDDVLDAIRKPDGLEL